MWGLNFLVVKLLLVRWDPLALVAVRFAAMTVLAIAAARWSGSWRTIEPRDRGAVVLAGLLGIALYQLCFVFSLERTTVFASSLLASVFPLFTLLGATALGEEHPSAVRWAGAACSLFGIAVFEGAFAGRASFRAGDLLALGASVTFAPYTLVVRRLRARYSPLTILGWTMAVGTVVLVAAGARSALAQDYAHLGAPDWALFGYVLIFPILIGYALLNWGIARIGAGPASLYAFGVPIVGGLASALVLRVPVPPHELVGTALCLGGLAVAQLGGERA